MLVCVNVCCVCMLIFICVWVNMLVCIGVCRVVCMLVCVFGLVYVQHLYVGVFELVYCCCCFLLTQ